jgi:NAD(P)-dependent dehydrogenase (short-subunit alcohol dehydrogenase family)
MKNPPFDLSDRVAIVTGGAGFMGPKHAEAIAAQGGLPVLVDLPAADPEGTARALSARLGRPVLGFAADVTKAAEVLAILDFVLKSCGRVDILVNNAANNPKVDAKGLTQTNRFEEFSLDLWNADLEVILTGSFLCCQVIGGAMAKQRRGVILNVASDLAVIAPDQRLYRKEGLPADQQPVKPITYSVAKTGLVGLTRYLATYWSDLGIRVNAISPGGVENNQAPDFVRRLEQLIPLGRMAHADEWQGALVFLCSDASSYITGINLVIDGGRSCW